MRVENRQRIQQATPVLPEMAPVVSSDVLEETRVAAPWRVILFNDDIHTFDEVIRQIVIATSCPVKRAEALAWQVHTRGKAMVFDGDFEKCFRVQAVLREIQLITEIQG